MAFLVSVTSIAIREKAPIFFRRSLDLTKFQVAARNWNDYEGQISQ
jgi:hypothetical protein